MKRAFPQEPVSDSYHSPDLGKIFEQEDQGFSESQRRVRTSAAMIGLALSVGASGAILPRQGQAIAAEVPAARFSLPTVPLALRIASMPGLSAAMNLGTHRAAAYHTVEVGQTLWQISQIHGVDVEAIELANGVTQDTVLQVGQVLRIPSAETSSQPEATFEIASANEAPQLSQAQVLNISAQQDARLKGQQDEALQTLTQKRDELGSVLARAESEIQTEAVSQSGLPGIAKVSPEMALEGLPENSTSTPAAAETELFKQPVGYPAGSGISNALPQVSQPPTAAASLASMSVAPLPESTTSEALTPEQLPEVEASSGYESALDDGDRADIATANRAANTLPVPVAIVPTAVQTYQIRSGDTIGSIASNYGITAAELASFNGIADPNFIVAGSVLAVPEQSLSAEADTAALAAANPSVFQANPEVTENQGSQLARLQATVIHRVNSAELLGKLRQPSIAETNTEAAQAPAEVEEAAAEPYVSNLLADVEATRQTQSVQPETTEVALGSLESSPQATVPLNPEFSNQEAEGEASVLPTTLPQFDQAQLFAAAPLGSEVYAPLNPVPTGRVVSPSLPVLPAADEFLPETPNRFNGYAWPTTGVLTSGYGWRWGRMHRGLDIAGPVGTPVVAAAPGVVERSGWNSGGYGNLVDIRHPDGSMTRYGHNSRLLVTPGQQVAQGQQIAEMGSTGYSTGPHLHFEVHLPGQGTVNPIAYLPNR
ncbi:MAG: peptidoglycan DD-metalloendopeptidase family protein [Leptolyngbyaceae cyanobacterium RM1_1_2]|nr:peptidoglycan DD-metalloendopeptidase family protein [Leptolyngbyaceae cyanobacterium RM1_1_2]